MSKIIFLILCLISLNSVFYPQTPENPQSILKTYSESTSYQPTESKNQKTKKEKKSKNENSQISVGDTVQQKQSITIPVSVLDDQWKVVSNLNKTDFQIFVDDKEIENFTLENEDEAVSIVLMLDTSPSTEFQIDDLQSYALAFIENLKPQDKVLIAEFNSKLKNRTELTNDRQILKNAIKNLKSGDGTALYDSLEQTFKQNFASMSGRTALVLITDGVDTVSEKSSYKKSLMTAEKYNVPVFVIYMDTFDQLSYLNKNNAPPIILPPMILGNNRQRAEEAKQDYELGKQYLNDLVRLSGGRITLFENLTKSQNKILPKFAEELRQKYYLKFTPPETGQTGERKQIRVRVNRPNLFLSAKGSFIKN